MSRIDLFQNASDTIAFATGEVIFREGERGDRAYVVQSGSVDIRVGERVLDVVGEGGLLGEMALIDDEPRSATAVARSEARLVAIDQKRFLFLVQQTPFFSLQVMRIMAERLRRMDRPV